MTNFVPARFMEKKMPSKNTKKATADNKLTTLRAELNDALKGRQAEIDGALTALLAGEHCLLLGPPGTAKTLLAQLISNAIEGKYFQWLMTKFSTPEELFGPISLKGLENDEVRRLVDGKLPTASIGFLDEIFKANSAILNALLTLINERKFHNNGVEIDCPLQTMFGASNELPQDDNLSALYDRFLLRFWTEYIKDRDQLKAIMLADNEPTVSVKLSAKELESLQEKVKNVTISEDCVESILTIKAELEAKGIVCSDRRWRKLVTIVKAFAVLNGHDSVDPDEDLAILEHCLWREPNQRDSVRLQVRKVASPLFAEATRVLDAAKEIHAELISHEGTDDFLMESVKVRGKLKTMKDRLEGVLRDGGGNKKANEKLEELKALQRDVKRRSDRALD